MKIYNFLIPLLFFAIGISNVGKDLFGTRLNHYPGDLVDTRFNNVVLEHDYRWVRGWHTSLWNPPFFYPAQNTLAGSDSHLGTFPIYALFRFAGFDMFRSFQAWVFILFALNFGLTYWVLKKLGMDATAASVGAFIFAFSMPVVGQLFHIQTLCKFPVPLVFYFLYRWLQSTNLKYLLACLLSYVYLVYCSLYFGLLIIPFILIFFGVYVYRNSDFIKRLTWAKTLRAAGLKIAILALLYPLLVHYAAQASANTGLSFGEVKTFLPGPLSYLTPIYGNSCWTWLNELTQRDYVNGWLLNFFTGIIPMAMLGVMTVYAFKKRKEKALAQQTMFTLLCSLAFITVFFGFSLYILVHYLPGFSHLKVVGRGYLIIMFFIALGVALCWQLYVQRYSAAVKILLAVLLVAEQWNIYGTCTHLQLKHAAMNHKWVVEKVNTLKRERHNVFVVARGQSTDAENAIRQVDAMVASLETGMPVLNGYTTATPPNFELIYNQGDSASIKKWLIVNNWDTVNVLHHVLICK